MIQEKIKSDYLFVSKRLGFRNWKLADEMDLHEMNVDPEVMKYFPSIYEDGQSLIFIKRMMDQFETHGYCYFAVDLLVSQKFIGFIGLAYQTFEADFTPCTDIGWRLKKEFWGQGFATEGANRCLRFAFEELQLDEVFSIASVINEPSLKVMKKIGMNRLSSFDHSKLINHNRLKTCYLYKVSRLDWKIQGI